MRHVVLVVACVLALVACRPGPSVVVDSGVARHLENAGLGLAPRSLQQRADVSYEWAVSRAEEIATLNGLVAGPMVAQLGTISGPGNERMDWDSTQPRLAWIITWIEGLDAGLVVLDAMSGETLFVTADTSRGDRWYR